MFIVDNLGKHSDSQSVIREPSIRELPTDTKYPKEINIYTVTRTNDLHSLRKYAATLVSNFSTKSISVDSKLPKNKRLCKTALSKAKLFANEKSLILKDSANSLNSLKLPQVNDIKAESRDSYSFMNRRKCLTNLAKRQKEIEKNELINVLEQEDSDTEYQESELRQFNFKTDKQLRKSCKKVAALMQVADEILKAEEKQNKRIKELRLELSLIKSDYLRQEEYFKSLKIYKEFLDECTPKDKKGFGMSYMDDNLFGTVQKKDRLEPKLPSEVKNQLESIFCAAEHSTMSNLVYDNSFNNQNVANNLSQTMSSLSEGEIYHRLSKRLSLSSEKMVYFETPEEFIDVLTNLEQRNLVIIENLQTLEEMAEVLNLKLTTTKYRSMEECTHLLRKLEAENIALKIIHKEGQILTRCQASLDSRISIKEFQKVFHFTEHELDMSVEELMSYIHNKIMALYCSLLDYDEKTKLTTLEFLYHLEKSIDDTHAILKFCSKETFKEMRKYIAKQLREEKRLLQKKLLKEAGERKLLRVLQKMNQTVEKKWPWRKVIERSEPPKKKVVKVVIDWDAIRAQEEYELLFTYKDV